MDLAIGLHQARPGGFRGEDFADHMLVGDEDIVEEDFVEFSLSKHLWERSHRYASCAIGNMKNVIPW